MLIIPISELRRNITNIVQQVKQQDTVAIITQYGKAVAVLLDWDRYNSSEQRLDSLESGDSESI